VEGEVQLALQEATRLQEQAKWPEALSAARRAEGLLAGGLVNDELRQRVRDLLTDLEMVARLEDIRLQTSASAEGNFDFAQADRAYAQAFREFGIDVARLAPHEAAERLRMKRIRVELAAALDDWATACRKARKQGDTTWRRILAVACALDPDASRVELRRALERRDKKALEGLAASDQAAAVPASTLLLLGRALREAGANEQAARLLRRGQRHDPRHFWITLELAQCFYVSERWEEAVRFNTAALALRPQSPFVHGALGAALTKKGAQDEAIAVCHEAIRLKADYAEGWNNLGVALSNKRALDEAVAAFKEAVRLNPDYAEAYTNLGAALNYKGAWHEAVAAARKAVALKPRSALLHCNLSAILGEKGDPEEAIAACREAIRLEPDFPGAYYNLGMHLQGRGDLDGAITAYQKTIRLNRNFPGAHSRLGMALEAKGALDEALAAYHEAIRLKPDSAGAYYSLGVVLSRKGVSDEAVAAYRKAIRCNPEIAEAHCNLGRELCRQGRYAEALPHLKRGDELGSRNPNWRYPSAEWVREAQLCRDLAARVPRILKGDAKPAGIPELLAVARLCQQDRKLHATAVRFFREAFAMDPALTGHEPSDPRYSAACAACLAGCGQGNDAAVLDDNECSRLRQQGQDWLRAELKACRRLLDRDPDKTRAGIAQRLQHLLGDADFAGVRGPQALGKLPEAERAAWQQLWAEVEQLFVQAGGRSSGAAK
jgi:tetratricopeptide (TPR) repeat protein